MEAQKTADGSAGRLETSKVAMAEETSTQYKPPTCEDVRASPKQQKEEQDDWGSFAKDKKKKNEGAAAVEETPEPVVVEKPADDGWDDWRTTTTKKGKKAKKSSISAAVSEPLIVPLLGPNSVDLLAKKNRKLDIIVGGEAPAPPSSSSRPSSVTWSIPPASKTTQSDAPTRVSQATTAVAAQSRIRIDPSGSDVAGTESQQTTSPPRGLLRRRSKSPQSRPPMGPQHTAHTCSEEDDDEWLHLEDEITPWDSASRPRQTARPRTTRPPVVPPSQYIRPTRETSTSREGQRTPRRRPHVVKVGHGTIEPLPTYPPFSMYPGYDFPYMSMPPRPYPGPYMGSVPKPFSPYVPSMISGTTAVPTPPELPFQRYPSPPRRRRTPSPPPAPAPALAPPPTPAPSLPPPPPPPLAAPEPSQSTRDLDPIALVESYLEALKESKEKELLDANRILSWIDRRSSSQSESAHGPDVESFQIRDDESEISDSRAASIVTSYARIPALAQSTFEPPTPQASLQRQTARRQTSERLLEESTESSARSLYSDNTVRPYNPSSSMTTGDLSKTLDCSRTIPQNNINHANDGVTAENPTETSILQEIDALHQDVTAIKRQLNRKDVGWLSSTVSSTYTRWKRHFRKGPRPGTQRLEWTCECGDDLFADLPISNSAQYQQMLASLTKLAPSARPAGHGFTTPSDLESGAANSSFSSLQSSQNSLSSSGKPPASSAGSGSTYIGSSSSRSLNLQPEGLFAIPKYLELCVNVGKYETKLAEIQVVSTSSSSSAICTDAHLFRKIYDRYFALRRHTWSRFLYRPVGIKFVHFGVQAGHRVGFFAGSPLPSEDVIASKRYEYNLQPPVPPPIDSRTFLHYFWKHSTHSQSTSARYVDRLPKKLGQSLIWELGTDELREGWGIHILEGPNKAVICWALLAVLAASFGVSLGYDLIMRSGDSGFAIGQWMVATLTVSLSALYFSLEDEVNSSYD